MLELVDKGVARVIQFAMTRSASWGVRDNKTTARYSVKYANKGRRELVTMREKDGTAENHYEFSLSLSHYMDGEGIKLERRLVLIWEGHQMAGKPIPLHRHRISRVIVGLDATPEHYN